MAYNYVFFFLLQCQVYENLSALFDSLVHGMASYLTCSHYYYFVVGLIIKIVSSVNNDSISSISQLLFLVNYLV